MSVEAELSDGTILEFPDGTHPDVVKQTVKRRLGLAGPAPAARAAPGLTDAGDLASAPEAPLVDTSKSVMTGMGAPQSVVRLPLAKPDRYDTKLAPPDEQRFMQWKQQYAPQDSGVDYDLRGAFKAGLKPDPATGHWPDTFKKPNHPTFSVESQYAKDQPDMAGSWKGETFTPPAAQVRRAARATYLTQPSTAEAAKNALTTPPTTISAAPAPRPPSPSLIPAGPPGSLSYAASGAGSGIESFFSMPISLAGTAAGALGAGAAAIPDVLQGRIDQAAEGVRQGMAEGSQRMTLDRPIFAPTTELNQAVGDAFEFVKQKLGERGENLQSIANYVGRGFLPPFVADLMLASPEAARTLTEYLVDAQVISSPAAFMEGLAKKTFTPDYGPRRARPEPPSPEPPSGPGQTIEGQAVRIDENAPRIPPSSPETPPAGAPAAAAPVTPAPPARGSAADLAAVMADERPLGEIRAEQVAQQAAAAGPAIQEVAQTQAEQQQVTQTAQQIATQAAGIPDIGERATITWPDGEIQTVTVLEPYGTGAQVRMPDGQVMDLTTDDVKFAKAPEGENTAAAPIVVEHPDHLAQAGARVDTEATDAQKDAGNYRMGHVDFQGLKITIETPRGEIRRSTDPNNPWEVVSPAHYGYLKRSEGADTENVDVYIGDNVNAPFAYVVDQINPESGTFDEHKIMLGFLTRAHAIATYHTAFNDGSGPRRIGAVTQMTMDELRSWLHEKNTKKPVAYEKPKSLETKQPPAPATTPAAAPSSDMRPAANAPEKAAATIIERIPGAHGMEVVISQGETGVHATLRDVEAGQSVATTIYPSVGTARIGAAKMLGTQPPQPGVEHATQTGQKPSGSQPEHIGVPQGTDVRPHGGEVRKEEGGQAGGGGGAGELAPAPGHAERPVDETRHPAPAGAGDRDVSQQKQLGEQVKDLALATQREAGWNPDWPFVPADLQNADFRRLLQADPDLSVTEKRAIFDAGRKLGVVPKEPEPTKGQLIPTRRPDGSIEWTTKPVVETPVPAAEPSAEPSAESTLPKKLTREALNKLTTEVDAMSPEEKRATAEWLDAQIKRQEEEGRKIADECAG